MLMMLLSFESLFAVLVFFLSFFSLIFFLSGKKNNQKEEELFKNCGFPPSFYHPTPNILHPKVTTNNTQPSKIKVHTSEP
jgi:hypothetical protein